VFKKTVQFLYIFSDYVDHFYSAGQLHDFFSGGCEMPHS
jgi:hypothetical protein